jgi:cystathionine beta-lyase/cystathionine gamma-synthase
MGTLSLVIKTSKDTSEFKKSNQGNANLIRVQNLLKGLEVGSQLGSVAIHGSSSDPAYATGTITLVSAVAGNTVTIGKTVFTFSSTPTSNTATAVDVEVDGADDTADAAALAAAINANALGAATIVSATSALGVVTVTALVSGVTGNYIALAKSGAPITVSGAYLSGGAGGPAGTPEIIGR